MLVKLDTILADVWNNFRMQKLYNGPGNIRDRIAGAISNRLEQDFGIAATVTVMGSDLDLEFGKMEVNIVSNIRINHANI